MLSVNDDAIALKGGKGLQADTLPENGPVERILVENCDFGFSHSCLTCGSEAIHCRNVLMRNCRVRGAVNVLRLKMRPDTPQRYEYIAVENVSGRVAQLLNVHAWTQFADPDALTAPSVAENITLRDCTLSCDRPLDLNPDEKIRAAGFLLENLRLRARETGFPPDRLPQVFPGSACRNLEISVHPGQEPVQTAEIM